MKLLMITSRNIDKSGGENALIMGRHMALYREYGIRTDIVFFHKNTSASSKITYEGLSFIECKKDNLYNKIEELLEEGEYQGIVSSGFYDKEFTQFVIKMKKKYNVAYFVDIHATIKEIYEYCSRDLYHIIGTRYLYLKKKRKFVNALKVADYAFVVSNEEIVEINKFLPQNNIKFLLIRCGCYKNINLKYYMEMRIKQRENLKINSETLAFVYSGSKDRWQKFEETKRLFKSIQKLGIKCKFAFYMNLDDESQKELYDEFGRENVIIRWVSPEEMKDELMAFDIGMLLRDNKWTNRVAFPNKYSDYIASGLHLCMSSSIIDPYKLSKKYQLNLLDTSYLLESIKEIQSERDNNLEKYIYLCKKMVEKELLYDIQVKEQCKEMSEHMKNIRGV